MPVNGADVPSPRVDGQSDTEDELDEGWSEDEDDDRSEYVPDRVVPARSIGECEATLDAVFKAAGSTLSVNYAYWNMRDWSAKNSDMRRVQESLVESLDMLP
jgi:hypothetical protein